MTGRARSKNFLLHDVHVERTGQQVGATQTTRPMCRRESPSRPLLWHPDQLDHPVEVVVVHHWGAVRCAVARGRPRRTCPQIAPSKRPKRPGNAFFDQGVIRGDAHLAVVEAFAPGHALAGVHEMGCGIHHGRTLSTQFQGEEAKFSAAARITFFPMAIAAREANVLEGRAVRCALTSGAPCTTVATVSGKHVGYVRKHLDVSCVLRWLDDDTVPSCQGADKWPQSENEWEIPR